MSVTHITGQQLRELLQQDPAPFLLDVRHSFELIAFGAIPGVTNIPMDDLPERLEELPADRSHPVVVICQSGARSADVAAYLARKGFTRVLNLSGGTYAWQRSAHA